MSERWVTMSAEKGDHESVEIGDHESVEIRDHECSYSQHNKNILSEKVGI